LASSLFSCSRSRRRSLIDAMAVKAKRSMIQGSFFALLMLGLCVA
jgi:hypothetical protein